jgi:hypothetical protein
VNLKSGLRRQREKGSWPPEGLSGFLLVTFLFPLEKKSNIVREAASSGIDTNIHLWYDVAVQLAACKDL